MTLFDLAKKHLVFLPVLFVVLGCGNFGKQTSSQPTTKDRQTRTRTNDPQERTNNSGGVQPELVGKWCYLANVQANDGGRMSERCFVLSADGRYQYHSETSSSNPYGSSSSEENDSGRWSATETTITAQSNNGQTYNYSLEKRNHPKTGDPMLVVDGEAFVTYTQRQPW